MIAALVSSISTKSISSFVLSSPQRESLHSSSSLLLRDVICKRWSQSCYQNNKLVGFASVSNVENSKNDEIKKEIYANNEQMTEKQAKETLGNHPWTRTFPSSLDEAKILLKSSSTPIDLRHIRDRAVSSTQDEARKTLNEKFDDEMTKLRDDTSTSKYVTIIADHQSNGRGTQGRKWESSVKKYNSITNDVSVEGTNLFLTVCIPFDEIPVMITLLPLQIAVIVAQRINLLLEMYQKDHDVSETASQQRPRVVVKWPNDVLVNEQKISGTLIENEIVSGDVWMLIGIGVNVAYSPSLSSSPGKQVRSACSIQEFCNSMNKNSLPSDTAAILGIDIASSLVNWVVQNEHIHSKNRNSNPNYTQQRDDAERSILDEWKALAQFGQSYELRGNHISEENNNYEGEIVTIIDIARDGQLLVENAQNQRRLLVADYMF
jgi:biotin-(acetyl-CoA carboxylase) ligase